MAMIRPTARITPLFMAGMLLLIMVFLLHRLHPGGVIGALRGNVARPFAADAGSSMATEAVVWGAARGGIQFGIAYSNAGEDWMRVVARNVGKDEAMVACGLEPNRSGKLDLMIQDLETSAVLKANALDPMSSFRIVLPANETVSVAIRMPTLPPQEGPLRSYGARVVWSGPVERRVGNAIQRRMVTLESGTLCLSRPWPEFTTE